MASGQQQLIIFLLIGGALITVVTGAIGDGGSRCPNASCTPPPPGVECESSYERDDGCCPVWRCDRGQTAYYGIQRSSSSSTNANSGSQMSMLQGRNPFSGIMGNLFGNGMFGG